MELISLAEYAKMHGVTPVAVRKKAQRGYLDAVKVGRDWVIDRDTPYVDNRIKGEKGSFSSPVRMKMERLASEVCKQLPFYFTENPINFIDGDRNKYFLCFNGTDNIVRSWRTQAEAIDGLKELLSGEDWIECGSSVYRIMAD